MNRVCLSMALLLLMTNSALSLPEDQEKELLFSADHSELLLSEEIIVHYGTEENPAFISQGSLHVEGEEITIDREAGEIKQITALGNNARFQQQPDPNRGIVYGQGRKITFNYLEQILIMDENVEFIQDDNILTGHHLEYDMQAGTVSANSQGEGSRVNMTIQPENQQ